MNDGHLSDDLRDSIAAVESMIETLAAKSTPEGEASAWLLNAVLECQHPADAVEMYVSETTTARFCEACQRFIP